MFFPPFLSNEEIFTDEDIDLIVAPVQLVYELSVSFLGSVEEMIEMASAMATQGSTYPQVGFCFEEITEVGTLTEPLPLCYPPLSQSGETGCFIDYTDRYSDAVVALERLMNDPVVINFLKVSVASYHGDTPTPCVPPQ